MRKLEMSFVEDPITHDRIWGSGAFIIEPRPSSTIALLKRSDLQTVEILRANIVSKLLRGKISDAVDLVLPKNTDHTLFLRGSVNAISINALAIIAAEKIDEKVDLKEIAQTIIDVAKDADIVTLVCN